MSYKDLEKNRQYAKAHYPAYRAKKKAYQLTHKEEIKQYSKEYYATHKVDRWAAAQELKYMLFQHYSGGIPKCVHCPETDITVLCIDHINNDGYEHRKTIGGGSQIYRWLKRHNYPTGYQVLCHNCNARKEFEHRRTKALQ